MLIQNATFNIPEKMVSHANIYCGVNQARAENNTLKTAALAGFVALVMSDIRHPLIESPCQSSGSDS